jgi:hypothetical protein
MYTNLNKIKSNQLKPENKQLDTEGKIWFIFIINMSVENKLVPSSIIADDQLMLVKRLKLLNDNLNYWKSHPDPSMWIILMEFITKLHYSKLRKSLQNSANLMKKRYDAAKRQLQQTVSE